MPTLSLGRRLGPYAVVSPLGAGGMGEVYRARDTRLGRDVAIKVLRDGMANGPGRRERLEREARAVAALSHPNIVAIHDVGTENGLFFIVSELVEGKPLRSAGLGLRKILHIAIQISDGLAAAHAAGITHRDLKPDNILLTQDGRVKILDFGLAKVTAIHSEEAETVTVRTEAGVVLGTVAYMSPEQVRGGPVDHRSDIFSFGLILYELLAGKRAFQGETSAEMMTAILKQDAPDLPETVPAGVQRIVAHCLEKDPSNRFQSTRDLSFALSQSQTGSGPSLPLKRESTGVRRAWMAAAILVVIAISAIAGRWLWPAPDDPQWSGVLLGGPEMSMMPRPSPDGHLLAFMAMVDGQTQVALLKPESSNWSILTHSRDRGIVFSLAWSADGTSIYFDRATDVPQGIYSVPILGGEERLILEKAYRPEALPDGSLLVARVNSQRQRQLFRFWPESGRLQDLPLLLQTFGDDNPKVRILPDGTHAVAMARLVSQPDRPACLLALDLASLEVRRLTPPTHHDEKITTIAVSRDGGSVLLAKPSGRMLSVSAIPTRGRFRERTLFTTTSDIWCIDEAPDGSLYLNLADRPSELVRLSPRGGTPERIASFQAAAPISMVLALPDGRTVVPSLNSGNIRLMVVEKGKEPRLLVNTAEETAPPMTLAGPGAIAFLLGPAPRHTMAVANIASGRITGRIAPNKGIIDSIAASPDGRTLYFAAGGTLWRIPSTGGEANRIGVGDSLVMEPSGRGLVVQRRENARVRLFRLPVDGGPEREIVPDGSIPLFSPFLSSGALDRQGRLAVSLNPPDSWFSAPGILDIATGRISRVPSAGLSDHDYVTWTNDGRIAALQQGLQAAIWRFHRGPRTIQ